MKTNFETLVEQVLTSEGLVTMDESYYGGRPRPDQLRHGAASPVGGRSAERMRKRDRHQGSVQYKIKFKSGKLSDATFSSKQRAQASIDKMGSGGNGASVVEA